MSHVNRTIFRNFFGVSLVVLAGLALSGCHDTDKSAAASDVIRPVKVITAMRQASTRPVTYSGTVKARREASLSFRVSGKIIERCVNTGEHVESGTLLARLDRTDLQLGLKSSAAALASAQSQLAVAQNAYDRAAALFEKGFATQAILDDRRLALDQAKSNRDQARSAHDQTANQDAYSELRSDGAGVVTGIMAEAGQVVSPGTPVMTVARDGEKEVAVAVPESEIRFFKPGDRLAVHFWADPTLVATGVVREIAGSAELTSRTFAMRVSLPDSPAIRLGETATLAAGLPVETDGIEIPLSALTEHDGHPTIWIVDPATQTVAPRAVVTSSFVEDGVRISTGLQPGELVVTAGTQFMTPGKTVTLAAGRAAASSTTALAAR